MIDMNSIFNDPGLGTGCPLNVQDLPTDRTRNFRDCGKRILLKTSNFLKWLVSKA
jgi:hypothetical protein